MLVSVVSAVVGALCGVFLEVLENQRTEQYVKQVAEEFERKGMSPPLITNMLKPGALTLIYTIIFMACGMAAYTGYRLIRYRLRKQRFSSTI
jgi:hypothetical protein